MPTYRTGNNTYKIRIQHPGRRGSSASGGAANTANGTFGIIETLVLPRAQPQPSRIIFREEVAAGTDLVIQDALHAHAADNIVLTQVHVLVIQDALHGHTADNLALTQVHVLAIQDALHGHAADNLTLTENSAADLVIQDGLHAHAADNLVLTQAHILAIQDALHAHAADNLALTQVHNLVIQDALHAHFGDNVGLTVPGAEAPIGHHYGLRRRRRFTTNDRA